MLFLELLLQGQCFRGPSLSIERRQIFGPILFMTLTMTIVTLIFNHEVRTLGDSGRHSVRALTSYCHSPPSKIDIFNRAKETPLS